MPPFTAVEARSLYPLPYLEADAAEIALLNEKWSKHTDYVLAQLRAKNYENADLASYLNDFYLFSMSVMDCERNSFPNLDLVAKMNQLLPLLPRRYRQTVSMTDLTPSEVDRVARRVAKKFDIGPSSPFASPKRRRRLVR